MSALTWALVDSDLGRFAVGGDDHVLLSVRFPDQLPENVESSTPSPVVARAALELCEFLSGDRRAFDLPLNAGGSPFQNAVWAAIEQIPFGEVATYGDIAKRIERPSATRAVGTACGANPLPLLRPCHRVVSAQGLGGFSGGLPLKEALLALEAAPQAGSFRI
jgi:methylated-DNA-[protein]-cysteine S-methyltransferase